uniref:Fe2OG dioxygenase domain-containing protein n=1 Tax=Globisporangium ultimum (strain ATCC 200006 / CBS 805.95 / DAOM BR144) TaxID=431595 RepID=K3WQT0_GLOUD
MVTLQIPEVDLSSPNASEQLRKACTEVGFFYLVNHDIPQTLLSQVYAEMANFFHQPAEEKQKVLANEYMRGYTIMNEETLDPDVQTQGDTKEGYYICRHVDLGSDEMKYPLHGPNLFPDGAKFPTFKKTTEAYHAAMCNLGFRVAQVFAEAAGAKGAFDAEGMFDKPMAALRLLRYGAVKSDIQSGVFGAGAHTDYGLITLLSTDENPGLQIFYKGEWIDVPPRADAYIVNIGDMGERWTNGVFQSTRHRVVNITGKERYSVPFFYEPNYTCTVECFPSCVSESNPAKYPPTTSGEHLVEMYRQTHAAFDPTHAAA